MDKQPTRELQKWVFRHPGIWVIALSTAFLYITQQAVSDWGVLFLQKQKAFSLTEAAQVIGYAEVFGVVGNVAAGWLSDVLFRGNRVRPVLLAGVLAVLSLTGFLFLDGGFVWNIVYVSVFSFAFRRLLGLPWVLWACSAMPLPACSLWPAAFSSKDSLPTACTTLAPCPFSGWWPASWPSYYRLWGGNTLGGRL